MKKTILSILTLAAIAINVNAQNVNIPDANLKAALVGNASINTNGDAEIQTIEASGYVGAINVNSQSISDLTGIEAFINIPTLLCANNQLTTLDVSSNIALSYLVCDDNMITNLDLSNNTALTSLLCDNNQLASLNLTNCTNLEYVECYNNQIGSLDLSTNSSLEEFYCNNNQLTNLDISANASLIKLSCSDNQLTNLNLANGNNTNMQGGAYATVWALNNPGLTCVQKDVGYTPDSYYWRVDPIASYSDNCSSTPCTVNIPDANFKAYLVGYSAINTNGDTEIQCSEASAFNGGIYCQSLNISDLTGIEAFTALTVLYCYSNSLSSLDVSQNTALNNLACFNNSLNSLDVNQNTALTNLSCSNNSLNSLNINQNTALTALHCSSNPLNSLDVSQNTVLNELTCSNNSLSGLDVSQNTVLEWLYCDNNSLTSLDVSQNTALLELDCTNNSLSSLDISQNVAIEGLYCENNTLTSLDVSQNTALVEFDCNNNLLNSLNMANGNNGTLTYFNSENNPNLTCIQVDDVAYSTTNWTDIDAGASFSLNCGGTVLVSSINVQGQGGANTITIDDGTLQMEADVLPANADDATYTWSVVNGTGTASIDANGLLTALTNGTVDVVATANDGSGTTGMTTITISNQTVGINENQLVQFNIYPNPVQNELFIELNENQITQINIIDLSGKVLLSQQQINGNSINVSSLAQGVYAIQISTEKGMATSRFVKK